MSDAKRAKPSDKAVKVFGTWQPGLRRKLALNNLVRGVGSIIEIQPGTVQKRLKTKGFVVKAHTEKQGGFPLEVGIFDKIVRLEAKVKILQGKHVLTRDVVVVNDKNILRDGFAADWKKITGDIVVAVGKAAAARPVKRSSRPMQPSPDPSKSEPPSGGGEPAEFEPVDPVRKPLRLPEELRQDGEERIVTSSLFFGPVPDPATLKEYNGVDPGLALKIIEMANDEAKHRREREREESAAAIAISKQAATAEIEEMHRGYIEARIGQVCALSIGMFAIGCGTYAGVHGAQTTGCIVGGGVLVSIISAFISGRRAAQKAKQEAAAGSTDEGAG